MGPQDDRKFAMQVTSCICRVAIIKDTPGTDKQNFVTVSGRKAPANIVQSRKINDVGLGGLWIRNLHCLNVRTAFINANAVRKIAKLDEETVVIA